MNYYQKANCLGCAVWLLSFFVWGFFLFVGSSSSAILCRSPPIPISFPFLLLLSRVFLPWRGREYISFFRKDDILTEFLSWSLLCYEWALAFPIENSPLKLLKSFSGTLSILAVFISTLVSFFFWSSLWPLPILLLLLSETLELLDLCDNFEEDNRFLIPLLSSKDLFRSWLE